MHTLATSQPRFDRGVAAFAIRAPSQKSMLVVEKRRAAKGGFQAP
jgi:hypothetical protein